MPQFLGVTLSMAIENYKKITVVAPINIAVIKYWGKRDSDLILPTNSSISLTLSTEYLHTKTTVSIGETIQQDTLYLNGKLDKITKRISKCLQFLRNLYIQNSEETIIDLINSNLLIVSENSFPTAAGLASSASGLAALVFAVSKLFNTFSSSFTASETQLSEIARLGSGSASRSVFGGFVIWEKGSLTDGSDSVARQIKPADHWGLRSLVIVINDGKKDVGSTEGMQETVKTSQLFKERMATIEEKLGNMELFINERRFSDFAKLTMQDSNQFHSVCLDTYPPIFYLNDISKRVIRWVHLFNEKAGEIQIAYTFDAGPNCVL